MTPDVGNPPGVQYVGNPPGVQYVGYPPVDT